MILKIQVHKYHRGAVTDYTEALLGPIFLLEILEFVKTNLEKNIITNFRT